MKKTLKFLLNNKILIVVLLIIAIGLPTAIFKKAQGEITTIVVAVGIDKKDGKYQVSIQSANSLAKSSDTANASSGGERKLEVIDGEGTSISDALSKIEIKAGKSLGFEHCHLIVLSDSVTKENCKTVLDFFYRKANITLGAYLISTDESAKKVLEGTSNAENTSINSLQQNLGFNKHNFASANLTTLGDFFNDYYCESKTSSMAFLKTSAMGDSEGGTVANEGHSAIFQNGKKIDVIDENLTHGLNFVNLENVSGKMVVDGVNDDVFKNATVSVKIDEGKIKKTISISDETAFIDLKINLKIEVLEVDNENNDIDLSIGAENFLTEALKNAISEKIKNEINLFHAYCKANKIDACGFLDLLYAYKNNEYNALTQTLTHEEILNRSQVRTNFKIQSFR